MTYPYVNSNTKINAKKTSGQIDEVEKFVHWFSRYLFLEQLNLIRVLVLYPCTGSNSILCSKYCYFKLNPVWFCSLCISLVVFNREPENV